MHSKTVSLCMVAMFTVLIVLGAWIAVPSVPPFTLQTLAVYAAIWLLKSKRAAVAVLLYLLLGAIGLPVFSGFQGGVGVLLGPTGGYLFGFVGMALLGGLPTRSVKTRVWLLIGGTLLCYAIGTVWFAAGYATLSPMGLWTAFLTCVVPFLLPDALKLSVAVMLGMRIEPMLSRHQ